MSSIKIKDLEVENFKNIELKNISIDGRSFLITSKNGTGKSSLMDAIMAAVDSDYVPSKPIKAGEERGHIKVTLDGDIMGEKREYTVGLNFTQANQKGALTVLNEKGEKVNSPRGFLDSLLGKIPSPIHDFLRGSRQEDKARRLKTLKQLTGKEKELDIIDVSKKEAISERERLHNEIRNTEGVIYNHGIKDDEFEKYMKPVNIKQYEDMMALAQPAIEKINGVKEKYDGFVSELKRLGDTNNNAKNDIVRELEEIDSLKAKIQFHENRIATLRAKMDSAAKDAESLNEKVKAGKEWLDKNPMPNVSEISSQLTDAIKHNEMHNKIVDFQKKQQELFAKKKEYEEIDIKIKDFDRQKIELINKSNLPVKGLSFDDTGIYLEVDGEKLPLEEGQINTAKILEVGEEICMAMNNNLKVMFVPNASLYDKENLKRVFEKAHKRGFMVIAEVVGEKDSPEIVWFEDYFK